MPVITAPANTASAATPNALVVRDSSGRAQVVAPASSADIATKGYVDGADGYASAMKFGVD